ncbi:MAG: hypothetical protein WCD23_02380 [Candidatus Acidiferrales bacterium]
MARWTLNCPSCAHQFTHSEIKQDTPAGSLWIDAKTSKRTFAVSHVQRPRMAALHDKMGILRDKATKRDSKHY